jgi:serine/threonine-protein phosphatase 2A regulatory subunit A
MEDVKQQSGLIDPFKLLQDDLKDSPEFAIACIKRLRIIANAMGPTRVKSELLPFLMELCDQENDQVLLFVASQLREFTEAVGGSPQLPVLLPLLERLCTEEELVVRDAAVKSCAKLIPAFQKPDVTAKFVPVIRRLAAGDWFTSRVSACGLFACTYAQVAEQVQEELRVLFTTLSNDDAPMVRKAVYQNLGEFALQMQKPFFKSDLLPILRAMAADEADTMRVLAVGACETLATYLDGADFVQLVMPLLDGLQDDTSWRVRKTFCLHAAAINKHIGDMNAAKRMLPLFARLLRDKEAEVRQVAARVMGQVCEEGKAGVLEFVVPCLENLASDPIQAVRVAFSTSVVSLAEPLGKEQAARVLTPLILQLCKDEATEVRDNIVCNIDLVAEAVGAVGLQNSVLPALLELCKDLKWRVRLAVIGKLAMLAARLGVKVFEKRLQPAVIMAMSDHVFAIRQKCCLQIGEIVALFGDKWAAEMFFPLAFAIYDKTTNYLHRMTCLQVICACASSCSPEVVHNIFMPLIMQSFTDDVPNVRLMGAKTVKPFLKSLDAATLAKVKVALEKLVKDSDADAAFFGNQSLQAISK